MGRFTLPDLGEGLEEAQLVQWLVNVGDTVALNQPLCQVETAKAMVDIPSPFTGTVRELHAKPGETVPVGAPLVTIEETGGAARTAAAPTAAESERSGPVLVGYGSGGPAQTFARRRRVSSTATSVPSNGHAPASSPITATATAFQAPPARPAPVAPAAPPVQSAPPTDVPRPSDVRATPLVRKMARERGIDLATLTGTGPGGRIRLEDFERGAASAPSAAPVESGEEYRISTVGLRKAIAARMVKAAAIPQFTEYGLFDATALTTIRAHLKDEPAFAGSRLTFLPFFVAALARAVRAYPVMNARWDEEGNAIVVKRRIHVGLATDTERGLLVPVLADAQTLGLDAIAIRANELIELARAGRLDAQRLTGSTITITNVGAAGPVETGAPLLNPPEVCIVGFGAIKPRPTVVGDQLQVRPGAWISISCDHRVVDGATAAQFLGAIVRYLEEPERLLAPLPAR